MQNTRIGRKNTGLVINIIANASLGPGMSGGDRIFIECARRWARQGCKVNVFVWEEGYELCRRNSLRGVNYVIWSVARYKRLGFTLLYLIRTIKGCIEAYKISSPENNNIVIYSASDFWPDSLPALVMKKRLKHSKWVAGFYLFAPSPFRESVYRGGNRLKGLFYFLSQKPIYWLVRRYADMVFVTSEPDVEKFITKGRVGDRIVVVRGGVDTKIPASVPEPPNKKYDAVFIGRFHPQKGVLELIDIWKLVCRKKKDAKLAMIGDGLLEGEVKLKIKNENLEKNINLLGFQDGTPKIGIFKSSKIVVHPATYDSGGMAAAEGMACGLPAVGFDLPALKTYYPRGMLKAPIGDVKAFAKLVLDLLEDGSLYEQTKNEALIFAKEWDWDRRSNTLLGEIIELMEEGEQL